MASLPRPARRVGGSRVPGLRGGGGLEEAKALVSYITALALTHVGEMVGLDIPP